MAAVDDVSFEIRGRRDAGARRRVRQRQVGHGALDHAAGRSRPAESPAARSAFSGPRSARLCRNARCATCAAREIALVFQEPMTALNPVFTVGDQIAEALLVHKPRVAPRGQGARDRAARRGRRAGRRSSASRLSAPAVRRHAPARADRRGARLPARRCSIADEPTTALDVTIQAQILDLLRDMKAAVQPVAAAHHPRSRHRRRQRRSRRRHVRRPHRRRTRRSRDLFAHPQHPYTRGLLASIPPPPATRCTRSKHRSCSAPSRRAPCAALPDALPPPAAPSRPARCAVTRLRRRATTAPPLRLRRCGGRSPCDRC